MTFNEWKASRLRVGGFIHAEDAWKASELNARVGMVSVDDACDAVQWLVLKGKYTTRWTFAMQSEVVAALRKLAAIQGEKS